MKQSKEDRQTIKDEAAASLREESRMAADDLDSGLRESEAAGALRARETPWQRIVARVKEWTGW